MALGFPSNPQIGDKYEIGKTTYLWNGSAWQKVSSPILVTTLESIGTATISTSTNSISTNTGALIVVGGVGIGKDLFVGGTINGNIAGNITGVATTATNLANGTPNSIVYQSSTGTSAFLSASTSGYLLQTNDILSPPSWVSENKLNVSSATSATNLKNGLAGEIPYQTGPDETSFIGAGISGKVLVSNGSSAPTWNNTLTLSGTTNSTSTLTGALTVAGGVGIGGNLYVGGEIVADKLVIQYTTITTQIIQSDDIIQTTNATQSTSTSTGALIVSGGAGVGGTLWVGNKIYSQGNLVLTTSSIFSGVDVNITLSEVSGNTVLTINNTSTLQTVTDRGNTTTNKVKILNSSTSLTSEELNALYVAGGIGISKDILIGGTVVAGKTQAETTGTVVNGFFSNNTLLSSFTSNPLTGNFLTTLDFWSISEYRSARYFIQIVDENNIHISEIILFHNGTTPYISEYGVLTNNGQLGTFDTIINAGDIILRFTPTFATNMIIKMTRTTITI